MQEKGLRVRPCLEHPPAQLIALNLEVMAVRLRKTVSVFAGVEHFDAAGTMERNLFVGIAWLLAVRVTRPAGGEQVGR